MLLLTAQCQTNENENIWPDGKMYGIRNGELPTRRPYSGLIILDTFRLQGNLSRSIKITNYRLAALKRCSKRFSSEARR